MTKRGTRLVSTKHQTPITREYLRFNIQALKCSAASRSSALQGEGEFRISDCGLRNGEGRREFRIADCGLRNGEGRREFRIADFGLRNGEGRREFRIADFGLRNGEGKRTDGRDRRSLPHYGAGDAGVFPGGAFRTLGVPEDPGKAPNFVKGVVQRSGRGPDHVRFPEIAFHPGALQFLEQFFRLFLSKDRQLTTA